MNIKLTFCANFSHIKHISKQVLNLFIFVFERQVQIKSNEIFFLRFISFYLEFKKTTKYQIILYVF